MYSLIGVNAIKTVVTAINKIEKIRGGFKFPLTIYRLVQIHLNEIVLMKIVLQTYLRLKPLICIYQLVFV